MRITKRKLSKTPHDACASAVRVGDQFYLVSHQHAYTVQAHLAGKIGEEEFTGRHPNSK